MVQHEITIPSSLLGEDGSLRQAGWARRPLLDCNLENARFYRMRVLQRLRIKRWDYYGLTLPDGYFSATIAHLGYAGQVFIYLVDFATATFREATITIPFGRGVELARNSDRGTSSYLGKKATLVFTPDGNGRTVQVDWGNFGGRRLTADLSFTQPPESTVVAVPIGGRRFYYNHKINCMPTEGTLTIGDKTHLIEPDSSSGNLDWGRGVWEYNSFWVWASASGFLEDGRRIGLNLGYGFGDTAAATENTVLLDGRIHKLGEVAFDYDDRDFMRPWRMRSAQIDLEFTPFLDRFAHTNLLIITSGVHQMFGRYAGTIVTDHGEEVRIDDLVGWAEEHHARW